MEQMTLRADTGRTRGSRPARRLRREGAVPAVLYGRGMDSLAVAVDQRDLYTVLHTEAGSNVLINLEVGKDKHLTVAREIQRHPVRGEIMHLDFIRISMDEAIEAEVGVDFIGVPLGVREEGGIVETVQATVIITALPGSIPASISIDIDELGVGDSLKVSDLPDIEGVEYVTSGEMTLVSVQLPQIVSLEPDVDEDAELLEGEEGEELTEEEAAAAAEAGAAEEGDGGEEGA
jgi:large subunit ribosomal protein L25